MPKELIFIAHRGFRKNVVENTFQAFNKAVELKMDYIELDVHLTASKSLVVIHDRTVNRVFNGSGKISKFSDDTIKKLRSREGNETIPFLKDVLRQFQGKINFMIELKGKGTPKKVIELITSESIVDSVVISSQNLDFLKKALNLLANKPVKIKTCYNITSARKFTLKKFLLLDKNEKIPIKFDMISLEASQVTRQFIDKCHEHGILALCWEFLKPRDPLQLALNLKEMGIDGFLLDDPEMAVSLKTKCKP
ncbi:MAG: glycerophosphodiester phosphodiesterase [Promethearchaeota archaeon]